jgi:hypothetical protein
VQSLHVRPGVAQRVTGEVRLDGGKPGSLRAVREHAVQGVQQAEEGFLLRRIQAHVIQAVPAGIERVVVEVDQHLMHATATDAMTTNVVAAGKDTPFTDMAVTLRDCRVNAFPVPGELGTVIGMVPEADLGAQEALDGTVPGRIAGLLGHREPHVEVCVDHRSEASPRCAVGSVARRPPWNLTRLEDPHVPVPWRFPSARTRTRRFPPASSPSSRSWRCCRWPPGSSSCSSPTVNRGTAPRPGRLRCRTATRSSSAPSAAPPPPLAPAWAASPGRRAPPPVAVLHDHTRSDAHPRHQPATRRPGQPAHPGPGHARPPRAPGHSANPGTR